MPATPLTGPQRRRLPSWVALCAALLTATLLIALLDAGSLGIWLATRHSSAPMSLSELSGLALTWGLITVVPWAGLVSTVVSSRLWPGWEKAVLSVSPVLVLVPVFVIRASLVAGLTCSAVLAAAALAWLLVTGLRRARPRSGHR